MRTLTARLLGFIVMLLGAWGGIVAYAGPRLNFRMVPGPAWQWTTAHWELHAAPAGAVVLGGLLLLIFAPRLPARFGALLALLGGAWFIVGPVLASMWLGAGAETQVASTTLSQAARPLGYHYAVGGLIIAAAAYAWARCATLVRVVPYPGGKRGESVDEDQITSLIGRDYG